MVHRRRHSWEGMKPLARFALVGLFLAAANLAHAAQPKNILPPVVNRPEDADDQPADADEAVKAHPPNPAPGFNPIQDLIQRALQWGRGGPILPNRINRGRMPGVRLGGPRQKPNNGEEQPHRVNPSDRDHIDSRAPHDAKVEHQLRLAQTAIKKNDWKQAVQLLQQLLDMPEDSLHRLPNGRWQSVRVTAASELGRAPAAVLDGYQQQNGGLAKQLLAEALREGDVSGVIRVATRFFHTEAGYQAADILTMIHQDRAEFGMACQWLDELQASPAPFRKTPAWLLKAASLYRRAGRTEVAEKLLHSARLEQQPVVVGGTKLASKEWVESLPANSGAAPASLDDWRMLSGTASRTGLQTGSAPFLMSEWKTPYSSSHAVRQRIEWMIQELADQNRPILLAAQPLAIEGKGIYRDLRGVHVIDLETGASLWESIEGISAEKIATGMVAENGSEPVSIQVIGELNDPFGGQQADSHPLINLMMRDFAYNTLSSDGRQVFLIEDQGILSRHHPGYHWGWDGDQSDQHGFSWTTNRLSSYDLETGRPLWTVGGPETTESFQLPLAGVYFHGVPTPDGDDLFAIGSKGDEMRLWCLDRRTGGFRWSQLIGYADSKIEQDIVRRWMAALPSVSDGIVVCPTTIGWLVAVDRLRQSVLWAVRYSPPQQGMDYSAGNNITQYQELGGHWGVGAPVIIGQQVLYTPPEDHTLVCVDLTTGTLKWKVEREEGQYLAGVTEDRAIVVGLNNVTAYSLTEGKKKLWAHELGEETNPSGRGVLTGDQLFLPLSTGELRVVNLADGKTVLRTFVPDGQPPLGNLVLHRGRMASLGPNGFTGFRQQAALLTEIQQRKEKNPLDPAALLSEAEIHLLNRQADQALPLLKQAATQPLSDDMQERLHRDLVSGLIAVIRQNLAASEHALAELERTAQTPEERLQHLDLSAERFLTLGHHEQAFDLYWKLTTEPTAGFVTRTDDAKVLVQRTAWLGGRLRDVWTAAGGEARTQIDARIAKLLADTPSADDAGRQRLWSLIGFHPAARPLAQQLIEAKIAAGRSANAEFDLLRFVESGPPDAAAWAVWKLGELMERRHLQVDAALYYRRLESEYGTTQLPDGRTGAQITTEIRQTGRIKLEPVNQQPAWDERMLKVAQLPYVYNQPAQEITIESRLPFFDAVCLEYLPREQRMSFTPQQPNGFRWLAPLRMSASNRHNGYILAEALGHSVAAVHQDVLHVLNPLDKETLWSVSLDGLADGGLPPSHSGRQGVPQMWSVQQGNEMQSPLYQPGNSYDRLAAVQTGYVAVNGRRALHVLDSRTGAELWRRTNVQPQSLIVGGPDLLWIVPPNRQHAQCYRVSDGTPAPIENLDKLLGKTIGLVGNDLLLAESGTGVKILALDRTKTVLRRFNPLRQADVWKEEFKTGAMISRLSEEELLVIPSSGEAELVQVATGKRRPLEPVTAKDLQSRADCYALSDEDRIFVVVNSQSGSGYHHFAESLPSVRTHGTLFAWQRSTGKLLWKQSLANQHLIIDRFRASPVLVFCAREWKQRGNINYSQLTLLVLHKQSGKKLHESSTPTMYNGFHSLAILPEEQAIELRSYNLRMKLSPTDQPAEPATKGSD